MSQVRFVDPARLRPIADAFAALQWPVASDALPEVVASIGWTVTRARRNGATIDTGFPTDDPRARAQFADGDIGQISASLTDWIEEPDDAQEKELARLTRAFADEVVSFLGPPARSRTGKAARYTWDLANRGSVAVANIGSAVQLIVLQERYADIERREAGLGIADDRDPEADLE